MVAIHSKSLASFLLVFVLVTGAKPQTPSSSAANGLPAATTQCSPGK